MLPKIQAISVWMTVAMLLVQAVCPGSTFGCGCQISLSSCESVDQECCCSTDEAGSSTGNCPHCNPVSEPNESSESHWLADEYQQNSFCHCGEIAPPIPVEPNVPESSETTLKLVQDLISNVGGCLEPELVPASTPSPPTVSSSEERTHNFKQVVLCVWLT